MKFVAAFIVLCVLFCSGADGLNCYQCAESRKHGALANIENFIKDVRILTLDFGNIFLILDSFLTGHRLTNRKLS